MLTFGNVMLGNPDPLKPSGHEAGSGLRWCILRTHTNQPTSVSQKTFTSSQRKLLPKEASNVPKLVSLNLWRTQGLFLVSLISLNGHIFSKHIKVTGWIILPSVDGA